MQTIAIIGLGYVGLPLAIQFARSGAHVIGIDVDPKKPELLNQGVSYFKHIASDELRQITADGKLEACSDMSRCTEASAVVLCLPTPINENRTPDLSYILSTAEAIAPHLQQGCVVVLESTSFPGTTEENLRQALEAGSGMLAGVDFHLGYSPEREDPGNPSSKVGEIPKLIAGLTPACLEKVRELYAPAIETLVPMSSCKAAEAAKLLENIFRSVNIALVNELKVVYESMDIDIWEVIEAAKTKPFGYMPFYPGPGLGGHCIPIDPFYLSWKARELGQETRFIELAGEINTSMPAHVVDIAARSLEQVSKSVKGSKVLILGIAYKPDIDDERESPSYALIKGFEKLGAEVQFHDPHITAIPKTRKHSIYEGRLSLTSITDDYDLIVISTDHRQYRSIDFSDYKAVMVDTRNCVTKEHRPQYYHRA